jgi:orotidine-5'-phosphate decarboxylase
MSGRFFFGARNMASSAAIRHVDPDSHDEIEYFEAARKKLIVALDFSTLDEAMMMVDTLGDEVVFYKIGLGLQLAGGDQFARKLKSMNKKVFLDYKYYDIEETVRNAVARATEIGVDFLTVHGVSGILKGAVEGRGKSSMKILCVTVLTSMDAEDIQEMGFPPSMTVEELVIHRAQKAMTLGVDGVIASALEAHRIKEVTRGRIMIVTPGIRPEGTSHDDQKRTATPYAALKAGADYLVIGRPITGNANPREAAREIIGQMADALREDGRLSEKP